MAIKVGDYVVATKSINNIQERSVGMIKDVSGDKITVFFIGKGVTIKTNTNHVDYLDVKKTGKPYDKKICNICHLLKGCCLIYGWFLRLAHSGDKISFLLYLQEVLLLSAILFQFHLDFLFLRLLHKLQNQMKTQLYNLFSFYLFP